MKKSELKALSPEEMDEKIVELRSELIKQNAQIATGTTPKSPGLVKQLKKNIARMLTYKHQKEANQANE